MRMVPMLAMHMCVCACVSTNFLEKRQKRNKNKSEKYIYYRYYRRYTAYSESMKRKILPREDGRRIRASNISLSE